MNSLWCYAHIYRLLRQRNSMGLVRRHTHLCLCTSWDNSCRIKRWWISQEHPQLVDIHKWLWSFRGLQGQPLDLHPQLHPILLELTHQSSHDNNQREQWYSSLQILPSYGVMLPSDRVLAHWAVSVNCCQTFHDLRNRNRWVSSSFPLNLFKGS